MIWFTFGANSNFVVAMLMGAISLKL